MYMAILTITFILHECNARLGSLPLTDGSKDTFSKKIMKLVLKTIIMKELFQPQIFYFGVKDHLSFQDTAATTLLYCDSNTVIALLGLHQK